MIAHTVTAGLLWLASAQAGPLTINEAVAFGQANYPAVRAAFAEVAAAERGEDLARTAYLPRTDLVGGVNRATRNNVYGLLLPNGVLPSISGPVQDETSYASTFGSFAGALFSWEPLDFGLREANVDLAGAVRARAEAGSEVTALEVSLGVVDAYLNAVATGQAVEVAQATVDRMQVFADTTDVLVDNELRPGADESRARAELARAERALIRAEEEAGLALAVLAERMGIGGEPVAVDAGALLEQPPEIPGVATPVESHPLSRAEDADIAITEARVEAIGKEWRPRIDLQSALYGRGTGAELDGTFRGGVHGLAPSTANWAIGLSVRFDLFGYKQNSVRRQIEAERLEQERAERDVVLEGLRGAVAQAEVSVDASRRMAANTPIELEAARTLETQTRARYDAGLGTVAEVADAERLLRQAETGDRLARLSVWRALFALAGARGQIDELLRLGSQ
jgi:outer membrane protein